MFPLGMRCRLNNSDSDITHGRCRRLACFTAGGKASSLILPFTLPYAVCCEAMPLYILISSVHLMDIDIQMVQPI